MPWPMSHAPHDHSMHAPARVTWVSSSLRSAAASPVTRLIGGINCTYICHAALKLLLQGTATACEDGLCRAVREALNLHRGAVAVCVETHHSTSLAC
mmetsp:Transcript_9380/g.24266  ORF Transcript_9380/g.24266 Transcript_9380/m.24266 type:complete len:97 (-) Transcript_9380:578-868(-)